MKRIISVLLVCVMLSAVLPSVVSAYGITPFTDVKEGAWYYESVEYCYMLGIVNGMTDTTFEPNGSLTRAQFVQILAKHANVELEAYKGNDSGFEDVKANHWFNAPVCWAVEQGYVKGLSETRFGPNEKITREQLARLLYLYAESNGVRVDKLADLSAYDDEAKVSDWAYTQVQWAVNSGIISGTGQTTLSPRSTATRAQACRMIMAFDEYKSVSYIYDLLIKYVCENGAESPDGTVIDLIKEIDDTVYVTEYDPADDTVYFVYASEPKSDEGDVYEKEYREKMILMLDLLSYDGYLVYTYENEDATVKISVCGDLNNENYDSFEFEGCTEEEAGEKIVSVTEDVSLYAIEVIAEALSYDMYNVLTDYIIANGIKDTEKEIYDIIKETENGVYLAEYVPSSSELYFVYATDPVPGGSDVFDTEYREKVIVKCDSFISEQNYFVYTYKNEDSTKTADVTGFYDGFEVIFETSELNGVTEDEVKEMITFAADEAIAYGNELLSETIY